MKTVTKGKVIVIAAIMLVFVFAAPMCYAASRGDNYNHIVVQPTPQKVLIEQNLEFDAFAAPPIVYRLVSGNVVNTYPADSNSRIYNVNWPMSGAYYVNYNSTTKNADAQLSVEAVNIPLELKVGTTTVSFIAVGTKLRVDTAGINLFDEDIVDLIIKGPDGQIKYDIENDQQFTDIAVSELKKYGTDGLKTTGWKIGDYTFQIKTESAQACGLDAMSEKKDVKRGGSYYEPSPTPAPSPKKENEIAVPHLTPTATLMPTVTPTVTPILTPIPSSTPSPAVSPTPAALIPGSEFLFAMISIIIAVCLFRHRK
ncbi:MAG: hypothetical protein U9O90_08425 [Euryarchaeota archaeon]|nr:hypothetical protein [Euryarchaeota archaeon]